MKIFVLNGSPKGKTSVTMQYVEYLRRFFQEHEFEIIDAAQQCPRYEKNESAFEEAMERVGRADVILWAFPLYFALVNSLYKRFIELIFERGKEAAFTDKYAAALSTSIHFYDHTALNYIRAVSEDLGMRFIDSFAAEMQDLMEEKKRDELVNFFRRVECFYTGGLVPPMEYLPVIRYEWMYEPGAETPKEGGPQPSVPAGLKTVIVADLDPREKNLVKMAGRIGERIPGARLISLRDIKMGPCLGCIKCGFDNRCAYEGKDDFIAMFRDDILAADVIIVAAPVRDRYLSYLWQRFLERTFCRTHQPALKGKHIGFLISGALSQNHNTSEILKSWAETMGLNVHGIVSDEEAVSSLLDSRIDALAADLIFSASEGISKPATFRGFGGMKVFRDDIYGGLRWVFQQDHRYYRRNGLYDFPQKHIFRRLGTSLLILLTKLPPLRRMLRNMLKDGMLRPFARVLAELPALPGEDDAAMAAGKKNGGGGKMRLNRKRTVSQKKAA